MGSFVCQRDARPSDQVPLEIIPRPSYKSLEVTTFYSSGEPEITISVQSTNTKSNHHSQIARAKHDLRINSPALIS